MLLQNLTRYLFIILSFLAIPVFGQNVCDVEVSGVLAYCNSFSGNNNMPGYFIGFRIKSENGDTLNVVDLAGNVPMNLGKRIDDINVQFEPSDTSRAPVRIAGGADSLEFWYFGPFTNGDSFNIVLIDRSGHCDTVEVASGTFTCQDQDPNACGNAVPLYYLDFSLSEWNIGGGGGGNENVDQIFLIMQRSRVATCCQTSGQRCFEFIITLDEDDIGLLVDDVGNGSPGGSIYADSLNGFACGTTVANTWPFVQDNGNSGDDPICLTGSAREWIVLSCKQGNNVTGVSFGTVGELNVLPEYTYADCAAQLEVLNANSATWSSLDDPQLDNLVSLGTNNLNATFLYNEDVFGEITSCSGDTFTYFIAGLPDNSCIPADSILHDTTFVVVYPPFSVLIDSTCIASGDSLLLEAIITSPVDCNYEVLWSTGDTSLIITVSNEPGSYSVSVIRPDLDSLVRDCSPAFDAVNVGPPSIHCNLPPGQQFQCLAPLPPPDIGSIEVSGCGINPLLYFKEESNDGIGCPADPLIISRYYIVDFDGDTINTIADRDTCIQNFSFIDQVPPALSCPPNVTLGCLDGTLPVNTGNATATDNCSADIVINYTDQITPGVCPQERIVVRRWTATDLCGNQSACNQTIRVEDNLAPQINCPPNISISCTDSTSPTMTGQATASDLCDPSPLITYSDVSFGTCASIRRTWRATDACGNSSTCNQIITITDNIKPVITCAADITVSCEDDINPASTGFASATDQCDVTPTISHTDSIIGGSCTQEYIIQRRWIAVDNCLNQQFCLQFITVKDTISPVISCPPDVTIQCGSVILPSQTGSATASDNCDAVVPLTYSDSLISGSCLQSYTIRRVWSATDDCGNSATCIQLIIIQDTTPPVISCPANISLSCLSDTSPSSTGSATASDNCDPAPVISYSDSIINGPCPSAYTINRQWTAVDDCGNMSQCIQTINITDNQAPVITCPVDVTINYGDNILPSNTGFASAGDNCDPAPSLNYTDSLSGPCAEPNVIFRKWTATDACGNTATCVQLITIDDHGEICGSVIDDFDEPIEGVQVELIHDLNNNQAVDAGEPVVEVLMTDASGNFCFQDIKPCNYVLRESQPSAYGSLSDYDNTPDPDGDDSTDGPDNEIPVMLDPTETDSNNRFIDIVCLLQLPVLPPDTICDGENVIFEITDPGLGDLTYTWEFGIGSTPDSGLGVGPHDVTFDVMENDTVIVNPIILTISKAGCPDLSGEVTTVTINTFPNATINAGTGPLCYFMTRQFKPSAPENPGATYQWTFGNGAIPSSATGYGPHSVYYTTTGSKTVKLIVYPNDPGATCIDSSSITFLVLSCPANITGKVLKTDGDGIQGVNLRLFADADTNGVADNSTVIRNVFTNSEGIYSMASITPGNYVIMQVQPPTWTTVDDYDSTNDLDVVENIDSLDNLIPVTLKPSEIDSNNVFVEAAVPGDISGAVFRDPNNNQNPDSGEGIAGVVIKIFADYNKDGVADSGVPLDTVVTNQSGNYTLSGVPPGNYVLVEMQPPGYLSIKDFDASNDQDTVPNTNMNNDTLPVSLINQEQDLHNYFIDEIACSLLVTNLNDADPGSLRYMISCAAPGDTIRFHNNLAGETIVLTSERIDITKNVVLLSTVEPRIRIKSIVPGLFSISPGIVFEVKNLDLVGGVSGLPGSALNNFGIIKLHDVTIHRNEFYPESGVLIYNHPGAQLLISGNSKLMMSYD